MIPTCRESEHAVNVIGKTIIITSTATILMRQMIVLHRVKAQLQRRIKRRLSRHAICPFTEVRA
jgi:hypothetical protein